MSVEELGPNEDRLCCPDCRSGLVVSAGSATCPACGRAARRVAGVFAFLQGGHPISGLIPEWDDSFLDDLTDWARGNLDESRGPGFQEALRRDGLTGPDGRLTPVGSLIHYHISEFLWQAGRKGLDGALELDPGGPRARVLDVGCGAAQTLRRLDLDRPVDLSGVDNDLIALALGRRFARREGVPITLAMASAYALPFLSETFDLVLTRVALNYMHQQRALAEMVRVLRPGGVLFCRAEGVRHDLSLLAGKRSVRGLLCGCRDLGYGVLRSLTGWQPEPGGRLRGGRAFASTGRLARTLRGLGCHVLSTGESPNGPLFFGHRTQIIVTVRKGRADAPPQAHTTDKVTGATRHLP